RREGIGVAGAVGVAGAAGRAVAVVPVEDRRAVGGAGVAVVLVLELGARRGALARGDRAALAGEAAILDQRNLVVGAGRRLGGAADRGEAHTGGIRPGHAGAAGLVTPAEAGLDRFRIVGAEAGRHTSAALDVAHRPLCALRVGGALRVGDAGRPAGVA